jgi:hypothetical protein
LTIQWSGNDLENRSKAYRLTSIFFLQQPDNELVSLIANHLQSLDDITPVEQEVLVSLLSAQINGEKASLIND